MTTSPVATYFDGVADVYDQVIPFFASFARQVAGALDLPPDAQVLDLAAGRGALSRELAGRAGRLIAVDAAPRNDVRGTQIGFGEHREDRIIRLAAGEIDLAHQPGDQARGVDTGAAIAALERKSRDRQADAALFRFVDRTVEIAPERFLRQQAGIGALVNANRIVRKLIL